MSQLGSLLLSTTVGPAFATPQLFESNSVSLEKHKNKSDTIVRYRFVGGSWWIRQAGQKQPAGLFFAACGRPPCSNPTSSSTKKDPQPKLRIFFGSTLQKGCPGNQPIGLYTHQPFSRHWQNTNIKSAKGYCLTFYRLLQNGILVCLCFGFRTRLLLSGNR